MNKYNILLIFLINGFILNAQTYFSEGFIPKNTILAGFETGGSISHITAEYSISGNDEWEYNLRTVPKIAYAPFNNFFTGLYFEYEFASANGYVTQKNYGYGIFTRYYLSFINKIFRINKSKFLNNRLFFFSEIFAEKNNYMLDDSGFTYASDKLNTIIYGLKLGVNFRMFNKFYTEIAYVKDFDNRNGNFSFFHPELSFEYIFNFKK